MSSVVKLEGAKSITHNFNIILFRGVTGRWAIAQPLFGRIKGATGSGGAQRFQIFKTCHKIISFDVISRVFPSKFQQTYNYFRFQGMSFILKTCRIVAGASMIR